MVHDGRLYVARYGGVGLDAPEVAMSTELLSQTDINDKLASLHADWSGTTEQVSRSIEFADFPTAVEFVNRLAPRCEELDHHPDLAIRWRWVDIVVATHSAGGVTEKDLALAGVVDEVAAGLPLAST
jgi:4a-hydroxytetrahydrobiopterin dehydratase